MTPLESRILVESTLLLDEGAGHGLLFGAFPVQRTTVTKLERGIGLKSNNALLLEPYNLLVVLVLLRQGFGAAPASCLAPGFLAPGFRV